VIEVGLTEGQAIDFTTAATIAPSLVQQTAHTGGVNIKSEHLSNTSSLRPKRSARFSYKRGQRCGLWNWGSRCNQRKLLCYKKAFQWDSFLQCKIKTKILSS